MLFNLFGSNKKQEFIDGYAQKLADAAVEGEIDADLLEELIDYAREHDLSNKQLASAQALACDKAFEELFQNGYLDDDEYDLYKDLIDTCYMLKEDQKYKYTTISKRCNAIYKIQEKGLLPKVDPEFANVDYREGEDLHFAGPAKLMKEESGAEKLSGGVIAKGYHAEVDELRSIRDNTKGVLAQLEARLRQETGIPKLKIGYNHVFGYFIEVSNSYKNLVPETYIRKQTLTSGERYITQELKELESKILGAHERLISLERRLFDELLESIGAQLDRIQRTANAIAQLDVLAALAQVAAENNYCRPVVDDSDVLTITEGRHPVVEQVLKGSMFVPNDTTLNCTTDRCLIITGPNMAGKSTYMRQNALIALMAQIGSFVPAASCHVGVVDAIFTRIGASDDLAAGQSTFMVEMTEVAEILKNATAKSLVVLDEIGRGTSTFDGMSIARAVVEHIADPAKGLGCKTLFATHYHELTELEGTVEGVKNYNIAVKKRGEDITFLRRIVRGPADDSYGIEVAKLAGLPGSVTRRAHEVLRTLEASAPKNKVEQMDFDALQEYNSPAVPSEMMEKLETVDVETLTPIEALNFLYELKKTLKGSLNG